MPAAKNHLFLPGWGARASAYAPGLPPDWEALDPPDFRAAGGSLEAYRRWLHAEVMARPGRVTLAGHSMGAALSVLTAASAPEKIENLILICPAGLPLLKPMRISAVQFLQQVVTRRFSARESARAVREVLRAPLSALSVARAVHGLDLTEDMRRLSVHGVAITVVGCSTDTLVTSLHCRRAAHLLRASYHELELEGGHMWMFGRWPQFASELSPPMVAAAVR